MRRASPFSRVVLLTSFTLLTLSLGFAGPVIMTMVLHDRHMLDHNPLLVCFLGPAFTEGTPLLLYILPACLFTGIVLLSVASTVGQWYRTGRMTQGLLEFSSPAQQQSWYRLVRHLQLDGRVDFVAVDRPIAFCYGWLRPRILLARGAVEELDDAELTALLLHERYHLMQRDPLKAALSRTLALVFFFLPVVQALHEQYLVTKEIEADKYVLQQQGSEAGLLGALCKLILRNPSGSDREVLGTAVAGSVDCVNQRLDHLLSGREPQGARAGSLFLSGAVLAALLLVTTLSSWDAASNAMWHQTACSLGTCPLMP